ncbi:uracil-DNA glycosylase [Meridianimarinicoccus aquatilis]|uniref:Type-4 uracil-DNA glycosylase n=1 Tax=Meridianimarinicoccus aquatilis TaxID=2552766 RepID=A0A4R6AYY6_9RHOB|nr:uracil-DNA glycosylase [Fluviibacterium aquatile]TDL88088.1 uracil-DNA glycosylase [Fluviibacterium aquatile]
MTGISDAHALKALLDWQSELGADLPIGDLPVNRYAEPAVAPRVAAAAAAAPSAPVATSKEPDPVAIADALAQGAGDLEGLRAAMGSYDHCELKLGARNLVFADGVPGAKVMIIGEAPGREEDMQGKPFVGQAGHLLDLMLSAIGLSRSASDKDSAVYISNLIPWRPPQNRAPTPQESAMMAPFTRRHITLAAPEIIVLMGNTACEGLLGRKGITRLRGQWLELGDRPCLPMLHPAYLLRNPAAKREAWADLLSLRAKLGPQSKDSLL